MRHIKNLSIGTAALLGSLIGAATAIQDIRLFRFSSLGEKLLNGYEIVPEHLAQTFDRLSLRPQVCRDDLVVASSMLDDTLLNAAIQAGDLTKIDRALHQQVDNARADLTCVPGEGMAWARLGLARDELGASTEEVKQLFERSLWTAPSDLWVIQYRLPALARIRSRRGEAMSDLVRADVRTLLDGGDHAAASDAERIIAPVYGWISDISQSEYARLTNEKLREDLKIRFANRRLNISGCPDKAFNDWLYRNLKGPCETTEYIPKFELPQ